MDKVKLVKTIEKYSLSVGFICIFAGIFFPVLNYVSTGAFALTYVTTLIRQYQKYGKINPISFLLCTASMAWVILRQFTTSKYIGLFGQCIIYAYLIQTQHQFLGKVQKSFLAFLGCAVAISAMNVFYPSKITGFCNIAFQGWVLFRFLDPILEDIALKHRAKRLAEEARRKELEEQENQKTPVERKEESSWKTETIQA